MKVKELKNELNKYNDDSEVIIPAWNNYTETYACVDYTFKDEYDRSIYNDMFGTPGVVDKRLIPAKWKDHIHDEVVYIGTRFPEHYSFGDNDIDTNIRELNGEDGDPDLLWKLNNFEHTFTDADNEYGQWCYIKEFTEPDEKGNFEYEMITWYRNDTDNDYKQYYVCELSIRRDIAKSAQFLTLIDPGIEILRNALSLLKFEKTLYF